MLRLREKKSRSEFGIGAEAKMDVPQRDSPEWKEGRAVSASNRAKARQKNRREAVFFVALEREKKSRSEFGIGATAKMDVPRGTIAIKRTKV